MCGRRPRLNAANTMRFDSLEMAQEYQRRMNEDLVNTDPRYAPLDELVEEKTDDDEGDWLS